MDGTEIIKTARKISRGSNPLPKKAAGAFNTAKSAAKTPMNDANEICISFSLDSKSAKQVKSKFKANDPSAENRKNSDRDCVPVSLTRME